MGLLIASAPSTAEPETETSEVVVTGIRNQEVYEKYPDLEPDSPVNPYRTAPSSRLSVETITSEEIDRLKPANVFDLLNHAVGVLALYQGRKVPYSVRIRGDIHFAYVIDGVYFPSESGGRILQNLPVSVIEQIDVVRDATALTLAPMVDFGRPSGAPNDGFIVIRTRRPVETEATLLGKAESFNTTAGSVFAGTRSDRAYISGFGYGYDTQGRSGEYMAQSSESYMGRVGLTFGPLRAELSLYKDRTNQQIQAADPYESQLGPQRWSLEPIENSFWAASLTGRWNDNHTTVLTASGSEVSATLVSGTIYPVSPNVFDNLEQTQNVDLKHTITWRDTLIRIGGQYMYWNTPTGQSYYEGYPREETITGYFATIEQGFFNRKLTLDVAARRDDQFIAHGVDHYYAYEMLFQQPSIVDRDLPASKFYSFGAAWAPSQAWRINGRAYAAKQGSVENVPSVNNKELHPESQRKYEVGLAYSGWEWLRPALTLFHTRIYNAKAPAQDVRAMNGQVTSLFDETNVKRSGFELQASGSFPLAGGTTRYTFGYTYLDGDTTNEDYGRTSPRDTISASLQHTRGLWEGGLSIVAVSKFYSNWKAVDRQFHEIGDFQRLDGYVGRNFPIRGGVVRFSVYGRNMLDQRYETQLGYRDPGAIWGAELRVDLGKMQ